MIPVFHEEYMNYIFQFNPTAPWFLFHIETSQSCSYLHNIFPLPQFSIDIRHGNIGRYMLCAHAKQLLSNFLTHLQVHRIPAGSE
uniref:Uncharacterized protein n=1 Tax=Triticum urartu TaxID=4572 RepID=A0A8R7PFF9_TRIUA